jgi:hypothetical protein
MTWKRAAAKFIFDRYFSWRIEEMYNGKGKLIELDYRFDPEPRYGYGKPPQAELHRLFERSRANFSSWIARINEQSSKLLQLERSTATSNSEPTFHNPYFTGLDAAALYSVVATERPARVFEVGSGNSTKFVHRARRDYGLNTTIISIDPSPRAEVETLCDRAIRRPLEQMDLDIFADVGKGDILSIDGSHRCFTNTDVTVFYLEILPRLKPGAIFHIHDIFLPYDYPPVWRDRYYSEQYLLACWLLGDTSKFELMLSSAFVSLDPALSAELSPFWDAPDFVEARRWVEALGESGSPVAGKFKGCSFWATVCANP